MKRMKKNAFIALSAVTALSVGAVTVGAESATFKDVQTENPHFKSIELLVSQKIISGFGDGTFKPDATVTRGQAAKMIAGTLNINTTAVTNPNFTDIKTSNQYYGAIAALANANIITGHADQTFRPLENITQGQAVEIFSKATNISEEVTVSLLAATGMQYAPTQKLTRGELASVLAMILAKDAQQPVNEDFTLSLLHMNDTHGHVEAFPKLTTAIKEERAKKPESLLLHGGDAFSGTLYFNEFLGKADVQFLNAMEVDAMTLGNHEFDLGGSAEGHQALVDFIKVAKFPILSANIDFSADAKFTGLFSDLNASEPENGKIYSGMVKEVNGEKIGIFGLTTEETKDIAFVGSVKFENYIEEAKKAVKAFEDMGVNKIIALTHIGFDDNPKIDNDQQLAKYVDGIDVIVGGHTHTQLSEPFVVKTNATGEAKDATIIVQANEYGKYLGTLDVQFDKKGIVTTYKGELLEIAKYADDAAALEMLKPYKEKVDSFSASEIGVELKAELINPRTSADDKTAASVRNSETALGNIVTDGMLAKAQKFTKKKVVLALQNGGGIRKDIPAGKVTVGQIISVLPFGNTLALMDVTGAELKAAFEIALKNAPEENGGFLHISGGKVTFDSTKAAGSRVETLQYLDENGKYIDVKDTETYTVATNAFTAKGGDGFTVFAKAYEEGRVTDLGLTDWENLKEQLLSLKEISTEIQGRITDLAKK